MHWDRFGFGSLENIKEKKGVKLMIKGKYSVLILVSSPPPPAQHAGLGGYKINLIYFVFNKRIIIEVLWKLFLFS